MQAGFDGVLAIDKPRGITSRDAVNRAQTWFPRGTRIGHTGTLDPLATGVLVLCVGLATRLTEYVQRMAKVYRAGVVLGGTSDTDDADGRITPFPGAPVPTRAALDQALASFLGEIEQVPPAYSAAKVAGHRAYDLARKGRDVVLSPRRVTISAIDVLSYAYPLLDIQVRCGKGTYIRSLARDLGDRLQCGCYIASLRRLQVGCFHADQACSLEMSADDARNALQPLARAVADLPTIALPAADVARLLHGRSAPVPAGWNAASTEAALLDATGRLLAVVTIAGDEVRPAKVLVPLAA